MAGIKVFVLLLILPFKIVFLSYGSFFSSFIFSLVSLIFFPPQKPILQIPIGTWNGELRATTWRHRY